MTYIGAKEKNSFLIENAGKITAIVFTLIQLTGIRFAGYMDGPALLCAFIIIPLRFLFLYRYANFWLNPSRFLLWVGWDLSTQVLTMGFYDMYLDLEFMSAKLFVIEEDINFTIKIGALALFLHFMISFWSKNEKEPEDKYRPSMATPTFAVIAAGMFCVIMGALVLANVFHTAELGATVTRLPFKLTGLINYFALYFPFFYFIMIMDFCLKRKINIILPIIVVLIITAAQFYVSLSKGSIVVGFLLVLFYVALARRLTNGLLGTFAILLLMAFVAGSFMNSYRGSKRGIRALEINELEASYSAWGFVHRIFREGVLLQKFHSFSQGKSLREELDAAGKDPVMMHTYFIDRTPPGMVHSSGCTPLAGLYAFGTPYYILGASFLSLLALLSDKLLPKLKGPMSSPLFRAYFVYYFSLFVAYMSFFQFLYACIKFEGMVVNLFFPMSIFVWIILYLKFYNKRVER